MKRFICVICLAALAATFSFAETSEKSTVYVGIKGQWTPELFDWENQIPHLSSRHEYDEGLFADGFLSFGGSVAWRFYKFLMVQGELGYTNRYSVAEEQSIPLTETVFRRMTFAALEIPVLLRLDFRPSIFTLAILAGPRLTIPVGKLEMEYYKYVTATNQKTDETYLLKLSPIFGMSCGALVGINLGRVVLNGEIRYDHDFTSVTAKDNTGKHELFRRRNLGVSLGVEVAVW